MGSNSLKQFVVPDARDEIDLSELANVIVKNRRVIAWFTAGALLIGIAYAILGTPVYRAEAMLQVADSSDAVNDKLGDLASLFSGKATADAEIQLIGSRELLDDTVRRLHLDIDAKPDYFPLIGAWIARQVPVGRLATPVLGWRGFAWGGEDIDVARFEVPPKLYDAKFTLIAGNDGAFELKGPDGDLVLKGHLHDAVAGMTPYGPVALTVTALVARPGTRFKLARASTQMTTARLRDALSAKENVKQSGIVSVQLDGQNSAKVAQTVNTIVQGYVQRNVDWKSGQAEQMLNFLSGQLPQLRKNLDAAEGRYNTFRTQNGTVDLADESRLLLQSVVDTKTRMLTLQQQRHDLLTRFTPTHPSVVALDAQLAELKRQDDGFDTKVSELPATQQATVRLMRDVNINTALYTNLTNSAQQLRVLKAGQQGDAHIVDYAEAAEKPVRPKRAIVIAGAALSGLLMGVAVAFVRRSVSRGLDNAAEIEQIVGAPVFAVISHSERQTTLERRSRRGQRGPRVLSMVMPDDVAVEAIRSLRTALQFKMAETRSNVVMITGVRPGGGKTFLSVNLAAVLVSTGKRVLLIDADMRRGDVHQYLGIAREQGFRDVIAGADVDSVVRRQVLPNLDVLTRGTNSHSPAELLTSQHLGALIDKLSHEYDLVLLDTPPVLAVTDSALIGKHAGITLLVMRHGAHTAVELGETKRLLNGAGVPIDGILLSDVPPRASAYGTYSAYETDNG
jgi:tyrosine-protein kinase Etk/Wzc